MSGLYYLHQNGDLIHKNDLPGVVADIRQSTFTRGLWQVSDRLGAWSLLVEALASGANLDRIASLARQWRCNDEDAATYVERIGARLLRDGDQWCATRHDFTDLHASPAGFGKTALLALANLAKALGYEPSTGPTAAFRKLLKAGAA